MNAAVKLAERATLGALLLAGDVDLVTETVRRLRPADFSEPWHAELFRTIRDLAVEGQTIDPKAVGLALIDRLGPSYADAVRVADCLQIVPPKPDLRVYSAMVIESSIRREIAGLGVLLKAGALTAIVEGSPHTLAALTTVVESTLDAAEARAQGDSERLGTDLRRLGGNPRFSAQRMSWLDQGLAADRLLSAHPMPQPSQIAAHEADLVAALVGRPSALGTVRSWLRPDAITDPTSRQVYGALVRLADHGRPVDLVSVAWETSRTGGGGPTIPALLARVEAAQPKSPGYLARIVAADHLRLRADRAAVTLAAAAEDTGRELWDVIGIARTQTTGVRDAAAPIDEYLPARPVSALRAPVVNRAAIVSEGRAG